MVFGGWEWMIIALAIIMLFGAKRIPKLARGIGQGLKEFREVRKDIEDEIIGGAQEVRDSTRFESKKK